MKYAIVTFGCRVNQADSLHLEEDLRSRGAEASSPESADLVIVNTCSVTATADQGARQTIRRVARDNPKARIVATGCYATRRPDDLLALPNVLTVVRNDAKLELIDALGIPTAERFGDGDGPCGRAIEPGVAGRTAFTLRVQTGCDQTCAYCIIPSTRGRGRSLPLPDVLREAERVAGSGFKEIALTGVHLGSYGRDLAEPTSLIELLRALARLHLEVTFRISSLEPMDCTQGIIDLIASSGGGFAPHLHLPLQHASDRMLRSMNRPYTFGAYTALLDSIAAKIPDASIGTDMIVGFPGETEADFEANLEFLPQSPLSHIHVFPYSDRPGTPASAMPGKVDGRTVRERSARLREIGRELSRRFRETQRGSVRRGLTLEDGTLVLTDNYLKVRIPAGLQRNQRVTIRLEDDGNASVLSADPVSPSSSQGAVPGRLLSMIP